jgi:hypothetical protein
MSEYILIHNKEQLDAYSVMLKPTSKITTEQLPNWKNFTAVGSIFSVYIREVKSKKDGNIYRFLCGKCRFGTEKLTIEEQKMLFDGEKFAEVQLTIEEAKQVFEGVKVFEFQFKCSAPYGEKQIQYLNLVVKTKN